MDVSFFSRRMAPVLQVAQRFTRRAAGAGRRRLIAQAAGLMALALAAVAPGGGVALADEPLVAVTAHGRTTLTVELADDPTERARGLMFREALPADHGMLFDFGTTADVAFWMKNTPLSLDMIFIREDGEVVRVVPNTVPYSTTEIPSGAPVRFVLEVEAGTARRLGITAGTRFEGERFLKP